MLLYAPRDADVVYCGGDHGPRNGIVSLANVSAVRFRLLLLLLLLFLLL